MSLFCPLDFWKIIGRMQLAHGNGKKMCATLSIINPTTHAITSFFSFSHHTKCDATYIPLISNCCVIIFFICRHWIVKLEIKIYKYW